MIRIQFSNSELSDIILPKVQMNSKMMLQQLKSRGSQGNVSGTALSRMVAVVDNHADTPMVVQFGASGMEPTYAPVTPVLFVARGNSAMVLHHYDEGRDRYVFSTVNFTTGTVSHNRSVDISDGSYEIVS